MTPSGNIAEHSYYVLPTCHVLLCYLQFETTLHMNVDSNILRGVKKKELSYQMISIFKGSLPHLTFEHFKSLLTINVEQILNMVT